MNQLFSDSETFQKERPTKPSEVQKVKFYNDMAQEVIDNGWSSDSVSDIANDLEELYPFYGNGYDLAKNLEKGYRNQASYDIDPSFCEWLDNLDYEYRRLVEENVRTWVKAHNPQPKYKVGESVVLSKNLNREMNAGQTFYITGLQPEEANYLVWKDKKHNGGCVIAYERLEDAVLISDQNPAVSDTTKA
jgi:hypothetical protein